ncbi:InlB B-repeat-containing protein, partial [Glutamicibacter soli]
VEQATCNADGSVVDPNLNLATTEGVAYTVDGEVKAGNTVTVTATAEDGYKLAEAKGWTLNDDGTATIDIVLGTPDCQTPPVEDKEAAPVAPTVEQATCNADGTVTDPTVGVAETEGVAYTVDGEVKAGYTVTVTATAKDGYKLSEAKGWTLNDDGTATIELGLESPDCETLPPVEDKETAPVAPVVEQATCNADGTVTDPTVEVAETEGVAYTVNGEVKAGNTVTVTATPKDGFTLTETKGWTLNEDGTATFTVTFEEAVQCAAPTAPVTPDVDEPSEPAPSPNSIDNGQTPDESKPLANTGFSTGLVALAGALVMGAGLLVLKLRRETSK